MKSKKSSLPLKSLALSKKINAALRLAAADAIEAHRRSGHPLAVWQDGRVVMLPPDQAAIERSPDRRKPAPKTA
ncbi:MAG: hypothetical protein EXS64_13965 [Candidatus Latescibacteria bacterium]|nr:hypothetical protein [Candidatus Latescibacterota bacterium]